MHWSDRRERFRAVLAGDRCVYPASIFDALSARVAEDLGFEVGMFAGSVASLAVLGAPDRGLLSLSEFADQAYRINRAGNLPLQVDADHGFGNALNVRRTVDELETAGVAALTIEDTDLPKPFAVSKTRLISLEEGLGKIKAALDARRDTSLVIAARTGAVAVTGVEDAIARAKAYEKTGIDALFFAGVTTRTQVNAIAAEVKLPFCLSTTPSEVRDDPDYLSAKGVRTALQGHLPVHAAMQAMYVTLKALRDGTPARENKGDIENVIGGDLKEQIIRGGDHKKWLKDFLASG